MDKNNLWVDCLDIISNKLSALSFNTWFKSSELIRIEDNNNLIIKVDNEYIKNQIVNYYEELIEETLEQISDNNYTFEIITDDDVLKKDVIIEESKDDIKVVEKHREINNNLLKDYTFNNFIIGEENRPAATIALSVAEKPGELYNPLFIYGKSGLGKTHLMHAIGNYIVENSNKSVLYVRSTEFMDDYTQIFRYGNFNEELQDYFKKKYMDVDVLIIDDIQMLGDATKTQDKFFETFNFFHDSSKQIIISSDSSPNDLQKFEDRLKTRFAWGLTVNIQPPEYELKLKILKNKMAYHQASSIVKPEVLEYMAHNLESDVRHIEGAITRLFASISIFNPREVNLEFAINNLSDLWGNNYYIKNSVTKIQKAVADYYNLTIDNLKSKKRTADINNARQIAMYICKMTTEETIEKIGLEFNRDHATVIHACDKISEALKTDTNLQEQIKEIKNKIIN